VPGIKTFIPCIALALLSPIALAQSQNAAAPHLADLAQAQNGGKNPKPSLAATDYSKQPFVMELISSKMAFENDGTSTSEVSVRVPIQSQAGLQALGLLSFPYPSAVDSIDILHVRVTKPDQRVIETPLENVLEMPTEITRQAPFYSDMKEKQVAVKGLEVGDTLEFSRREHLHTPLDPGQFWYTYSFFHAGIALEETFEISVPLERYVKVESPKYPPVITELGSYKIYIWKTANLEVKDEKAESTAADEEANRPSIQLTSFRDWNEVGKWISSLFVPREAISPEIQQKANEITRGANTDAEKI